jgi:hypothetical protein
MREVSISQLWGRAWDLFKVNWLLLVGLLVLFIIVIHYCIHGILMASYRYALIAMDPRYRQFLCGRAIWWPARGSTSFGEVFRDLSSLLKIFVYELTLAC